jgi:glycosyltransferase involved in cell wall biosynthesis
MVDLNFRFLGEKSKQYPFVTVVVPVYNEKRSIGDTLRSLLSQEYPSRYYEIIVVDNGSTDGTLDIVKRSGVKVLQEPIRSSYRARNKGIKEARGNYVAFIDGDCIAHNDWLKNLIDVAMKKECGFIAGKTINVLREHSLGNRLYILRCSPETRRESIEQYESVPAVNMLVNMKLFDTFGLFREVISGSDIEFSKRVTNGGEKVIYAEKAIVEHQCYLSNSQYLNRSFRIRFGQELNQRNTQFCKRFLKTFASVPWKPGFSVANRTAKLLNIKDINGFIGLWLYMWLDRLFGYFGAMVGIIRAFFLKPTNFSKNWENDHSI